MGATPEQISAMDRDDLTSFDEGWVAALRVAASQTSNHGSIPPEEYEALSSHWSPAQIVEIVAVIGIFNYFNRFAVGLDIPPTK
jgi:alkylhydroperoxidase family enzyme